MDLWIRSQNKELLMKSSEFRYSQKKDEYSLLAYDTAGVYRVLGSYSSKERALRILDDMQNCLLKGSFAKIQNGLHEDLNLIPNPIFVYTMPEE